MHTYCTSSSVWCTSFEGSLQCKSAKQLELVVVQVEAQILLGDRRLHITLARVWGSLSSWEKTKLMWMFVHSGLTVSKIKQDISDDIEKLKVCLAAHACNIVQVDADECVNSCVSPGSLRCTAASCLLVMYRASVCLSCLCSCMCCLHNRSPFRYSSPQICQVPVNARRLSLVLKQNANYTENVLGYVEQSLSQAYDAYKHHGTTLRMP